MEPEPLWICNRCGKVLNPARVRWVNLDNTNGQHIAPDAELEHGQWGWQMYGTECVKSLGVPKEWIYRDPSVGA